MKSFVVYMYIDLHSHIDSTPANTKTKLRLVYQFRACLKIK